MFRSLEKAGPEEAGQHPAGQQDSRGAILVTQLLPGEPAGPNPLRELSELAVSAGAVILGEVVVERSRPVAATYIGSGKARELATMVSESGASLVIMDHALTPGQERNLERIVGCRVLDRTGLILDIFAQRAKTSEGKLQVELAQLRHLTTRLVRGWTHLERQKGGIGLRGPGETQLETDRRLIGIRIKTLTRRLQKVESQRRLRRRSRERTPIPTVSLVGYTNAGKSSLFNRLTGAGVYAADKLFATLDPTMRRLEVPGFGPVVLSDTVGFVRDLPHNLVAAFHSTLEEVANASCLLLVNDVSDPDGDELIEAVESVLQEIGADEVPRILVHNKIDLTDEEPRRLCGQPGSSERVWLSASSGAGTEELMSALASLLGSTHRQRELRVATTAGALRSQLYRRCEVRAEDYDQDGNSLLSVFMSPRDQGWLESSQEFEGDWAYMD